MRKLLVLFVCFVAVPPYICQAQEGTIFYTGQLDGLAGSTANCSAQNNCTKLLLDAAGQLSNARHLTKGSILVGMGDNYSPDPGSTLLTQLSNLQRLNPKFSGPPSQMVDYRAVSFLSASGYDGVVPGVQDFYFGAEFVRRSQDVVKFVATNVVRNPMQPSTCPSYPQLPAVSILLPNQISSSVSSGSSSGAAGSGSGAGGGKGKGKKGGGGGGASSAGGSSGGASSSSGGGGAAGPSGCKPSNGSERHKSEMTTVPTPKLRWPDANSIYPWSSELGLIEPLNTPSAPETLYVCPPEAPDASEWVNPASCFEIDRADQGSSIRYEIKVGNLGVSPEGKVLWQDPSAGLRLFAGAQLRLCNINDKKPGEGLNHACSDLKVQDPMFDYAWRAPSDSQYVILGALAPNTLNGLSAIDISWSLEKGNPDVARQVGVNEPSSALLQALKAFDKMNASRIGLLLAQMSPAEAKSLADSLGDSLVRYGPRSSASRISMIISAADFAESTPHLKVDIDGSEPGLSGSQEPYYIPVLTPAPVFQKQDCLEKGAVACVARIVPTPAPSVNLTAASVQLENFPSRIEARVPHVTLNTAQVSSFCADLPTAKGLLAWKCQVLSTMVRDTSAIPKLGNSCDIAVLEAKDFDFSRGLSEEALTGNPSHEEAEQILWKAGRLARVSLLGQTIESLLQANDKLGTHSFQLLPASRDMQQLIILGVKKVGSTYFINGMPLSESQVYSVATSDRLANSTSDFPQLAQTDLDNPNLFPVHGKTVLIGDIAPQNPTVVSASLYEPHDLEGMERQAAKREPSPDPKDPSYSYSNRLLSPDLPVAEKDRQFRPMVRLILQQMALSYSASTPNQSDPNIGANFGGVSNPNVSSPSSKSLSALQNARALWYPPTRKIGLEDVGLDDLLNIAESVQGSLALPSATSVVTTTGDAVPGSNKSFTGNSFTLSPFAEWQTPGLPVLKLLVVRGIATNNVATPISQYLSGCTAGSATSFISNGTNVSTTCDANATKDDFKFALRKTWSLGESIGTRIERDDFRYFEFGYLHQRSHDVLRAVGVSNAGPNAVTLLCSLIGTQSLTTCAGNLPAVTGIQLQASYANYSQDGGYVLGLWTKPLIKHVVFQGSGFGNFFAYGNKNQSSLTHYAFNAMATVLVSLPANLSVGPTLNEFFFQDNATRSIGTSLVRRTVGVQFNYNFDWHTGVSPQAFSGNKP